MKDMDRREFVRLSLMLTAYLSIFGCDLFLDPGPELTIPDKDTDDKEKEKTPPGPEEVEKEEFLIPRRKLGGTGLQVSIFSLGGAFTVSRAQMRTEAVNIINRAIDLGVNYIDTAPTYGNSENNIGEVMRNRRNETYLAGKTLNRHYDGAMREIEKSLKNLQTSHLDIYQLHGIHSEDDLRQIFGRDGAVKALEELKQGGVIRFTGITGHKNHSVFLKALGEYDFDTALIPLNPGEVHTDSFAKNVLPVLIRKNMGIIAMKVAAYGRIFRREGISSMEQALSYVLSHPVNTAVIGISTIEELEENTAIARQFEPLSREQMRGLEELTKPYQREANFFKYDW